MSELLLQQLQQVLEPWDSLPVKDNPDEVDRPESLLWAMPPPPVPESVSTSSPSKSPSLTRPANSTDDGYSAEGPAATCMAYSRAATTKLELARAALALFASNAGVYRPFLVKLFRFLFDFVDELREEQGRMRMEWWTLHKSGGSAAIVANEGSGGFLGATPEEQNAVSAAFEKVRLTENRMAALVEEAAVQRDHFQSQLKVQKSYQYHLEDILCHQVGLTQILLDHHLYQDVVAGKQSMAVSIVAAESSRLPAIHPAGGMRPKNGDSVDSRGAHNRMHPAQDATPSTRDVLGLRSKNAPVLPPERRDAAHVQRLVARAEKELVLERTEVQLRDLRAQHDNLQGRVQSLMKLNARYARQSIELSARLSVLQEHNIALAADVQLFQRDYVKVLHWVEHLQRDLQVARGTVLTMLQLQKEGELQSEGGKGEDVPSVLGGEEGEVRSRSDVKGNDSKSTMTYSFESAASLSPAAATEDTDARKATSGNGKKRKGGKGARVRSGAEEEGRGVHDSLPGERLRNELRELLKMSDPDRTGVKLNMLQTLYLLCGKSLHEGPDTGGISSKMNSYSARGWRSLISVSEWVPPYGLHAKVPLQLRSRSAVRLLHLHPLVAEVLVHELLSQREELLWFAQEEAETQRASTRTGEGLGSRKASIDAVTTTSISFPDYIALFVIVVWLNGLNGNSHLLPPLLRARLLEEVQARRGSSDAASQQTAAPTGMWSDAGDTLKTTDRPLASTSLWDLRYIVHHLCVGEEMSRLPPEGLQLTYALDKASLQVGAGPLTYAYGLTSRGSLCDILFHVFRSERSVFVGLCRAIDANIVAAMQEEQQRAVEALIKERGVKQTKKNVRQLDSVHTSPPPPPPDAPSMPPLRGFIPANQVARILLAMYPSYPTTTIEDLIRAAVADGTNAAENPSILYYEVLLPSRTLPGPTTVSMTMDLSMAAGTTFASLFYTAICVDALESMQMVEDSIGDFAYGQKQLGSMSAEAFSGAALAASGAVTATAQQLTSVAFQKVPHTEAEHWLPSLKSVIYQWPRLRARVIDASHGVLLPLHQGTGADGDVDTSRQVSDTLPSDITTSAAVAARGSSGLFSQTQNTIETTAPPPTDSAPSMSTMTESMEHPEVSSVAQVSVEEVMPYLRRNLLLRRGLYDMTDGKAVTPARAPRTVTAGSDRGKEIFLNEVPETAASPTKTKEVVPQWSAAQEEFLNSWDARWSRYRVATVASSSPFIGPTELVEFKRFLRQADPHRPCPWGSEFVSRENPLMHPIIYSWEKRESPEAPPKPKKEARNGGSRAGAKKKVGKDLV